MKFFRLILDSMAHLAQAVRHRHLVSMMVRRDLAQRYRGAAMGVIWALLQPLCMLLLYTFVFSVILKVKYGSDTTTGSFALYLFCGLLPWLAFSEAVTRCTSVILENANLVRKVVFPLEILPVNVVTAALVTQGIGSIILIGAILVAGIQPSWTWFLVPLLLVPQIMWTLGLGWLLASVGVYVRDIGQMIGLLLTAWMFLTPIYYPASLIPERFKLLVDLNPLAAIVEAYRALFLQSPFPDLRAMLIAVLGGAAVFILGHAWFFKTKKGFADVL